MIRSEIADLVRHGPLPTEDDDAEAIEHAEVLLHRIEVPVTDEEAYALIPVFGPDDCYGLAATLLHVIETAPGITRMTFPRNTGKYGVERLIARQENWMESNDGIERG